MPAFLFVKYVINNLKNNSCKFVKFVVKKHIISDKILGCFAQASKDGNLLIILISFLDKIIPSFF